MPDSPKPTGLIFDGVAASEQTDSSGERLLVGGCDISNWEKGLGTLNWEHRNATAKEASPMDTVGTIIYAKKIFGLEDCDTDRQKECWKAVELPLIYVICRLYDQAGHAASQALAAQMRDHHANGEKIICRLSIEGSTVRQEGNILAESIAMRLAVTLTPCNRTCDVSLLADPNAPDGYDRAPNKAVKDLLAEFADAQKAEPLFSVPPLSKSLGGDVEMERDPVMDEKDLAKTLTAGSYDAAPSSLSGGAMLQKESMAAPSTLRARALAALKDYGKRPFDRKEFRAFVKAALPEASDDFLDHFTSIADDYHVKRSQLTKAVKADVSDFVKSIKLQHLDLELRKATDQLATPPKPTLTIPSVYAIYVKIKGKNHRSGRYMIVDNTLYHLEDYFGLLAKFIPEGPITPGTVAMLHVLRTCSALEVVEEHPQPESPAAPSKSGQDPLSAAPTVAPTVRPPSVFEYHRAGMDAPHTLEVKDGVHLLDGNRLTFPEVQTIMHNLKAGVATVRYKSPGRSQSKAISKAEEILMTLMKTDTDMDAQTALTHVRELLGHDHPTTKALTRHIYEDAMTPGIGNKKAFNEHKSKQKPGTYVAIDGNSMKRVNDAFGHEVGDHAIVSLGAAARAAMDEAVGRGSGKLFRTGGDEFVAHVPTHEHAAAFSRSLSEKLRALPPIGGVHQLSMSFGFGHSPDHADKALYEAKKQKLHPETGVSMYKPGQEPSFAHSLVPGAEGAVPLTQPHTAAIHDVMKQPDVKEPKLDTATKAA